MRIINYYALKVELELKIRGQIQMCSQDFTLGATNQGAKLGGKWDWYPPPQPMYFWHI